MCFACEADAAVEREEELLDNSVRLYDLLSALEHDSLVSVFKPDKYGFSKEYGIWFDQVEKVVNVIKENSNGATD